jgi:membrane fusion protein
MTSERERLLHLIDDYTEEQATLQTQRASQEQRIKLADNLVMAASELRQKGLLSNLKYTSRLSNVLEQRQKLDTIEQQRLRLLNQIIETRALLDQLPTVIGEKIQFLRNELAQTEQRMSEVNGRRAYIVRAPAAGKIALLAASPGQTVDPKRLLLTIVPTDSPLQAELLVPAHAIGFIAPGQAVRILYDAFPYQEFGAHSGVVRAVSQTMTTEDDGPIRLRQPSYRVHVALNRFDMVLADSRFIPIAKRTTQS